jgi:transketolase
MEDGEILELKKKAREIRILTIDAIGRVGMGHIGGSLSIVELLTLLYFKVMNVDPADPKKRERDKLVLSKGHSGPGLYSTLACRGFFPREWLLTLNKGGTNLPSHCDMNRTPGIDMTTGSLGQGISAAIGIALADRLDGVKSTVYTVIGDGECNEGQVWEAAMAARQFRLDNLLVFLDYNKLQVDGFMRDIMDVEDITSKWNAFGWFVQRTNGHDFREIESAVVRAQGERGRPSVIVLDTIKGKDADFAEGKPENHNMVFEYRLAQAAIQRLEEMPIE